jgi:hypothetical protein
LDSTGSGQGQVAGYCECGDEPSDSWATELVSYSRKLLRPSSTLQTGYSSSSVYLLFLSVSSYPLSTILRLLFPRRFILQYIFPSLSHSPVRPNCLVLTNFSLIIIISGPTVPVKILAASHRRFCNLSKTVGRTTLDE